jgi:hypothetical protein
LSLPACLLRPHATAENCDRLSGCFPLDADPTGRVAATQRSLASGNSNSSSSSSYRLPGSLRKPSSPPATPAASGVSNAAGAAGAAGPARGSSPSTANSITREPAARLRMCVPQRFRRMSSKALSGFMRQVWELDEAVFGRCAGACWLREVSSTGQPAAAGSVEQQTRRCRTTRGTASAARDTLLAARCTRQARMCRMLRATNRKECEDSHSAGFCAWERSSGSCGHKAMEFNSNFDFRVKRLYG